MDPLSSIFLGLIQGLTEFLPVSSSGHLILAREVFGFSGSNGLAVDAVLHFATAAAIGIYFRKEVTGLVRSAYRFVRGRGLGEGEKALLFALTLGTIPAVVLGLLLEDVMATAFRNPELVAGALVAGSIVMFFGEWHGKRRGQASVTAKKGLAIGLFQSLALIPGMSRSGMTIAGGMALGLSREEAARFGFLLGFPLFLGAGLKKILDLSGSSAGVEFFPIFLGAVAAFVSGILAIHYLLRFLRSYSLNVFILYRLIIALLVLLLL